MSDLVVSVKNSFTGGEIAPELLGRGDLRAFQNGARRLRNVFIYPTGGLTRRSGLAYVDTAVADVANGPVRLVAFEFNTEQAYLLALTIGTMGVYVDGARVATVNAPWQRDHIPQLCWTQSADTLLVVNPDMPPQKITRTSNTGWTVEAWSFYEKDGVKAEPSHKFAAAAVTLQPSGTSGTVTLTASDDVFVGGHAGLQFRLNNKAVTITAVTSGRVATAHVLQSLTSDSATTDWEEPAFSAVRGWPVSVCFHQDRLVVGGSRDLPNRLWMSRSADLFNFDLGTGLDDESIEFALLSDQVNAIRAVFSGRTLQVLTSGAEWMVSGDPLTPSRIQLKRQTRMGSPTDRAIPPRDVDGATLFVARNGTQVVEFLYGDVQQSYQANDLSMCAHHLVNDPVDQDYDPLHRLFHVVMADGSLATLTNYRAEQVTAWTRQDTDGLFRCVAVVNDDVYVVVERGGKLLIERFDANLAVDSGVRGVSVNPLGSTVWWGLGHLEGKIVQVVADDALVVTRTVLHGAVILAEPAKTVQVGLPFSHLIEPLPPGIDGAAGGGQGILMRMVSATFRVLDTQALSVDTGRGYVRQPLRQPGATAVMDTGPQRFTGDVKVRVVGWHRDATASLWRVQGVDPLSCTILSVTTEIKTGG